jgi:hypothetical protein
MQNPDALQYFTHHSTITTDGWSQRSR